VRRVRFVPAPSSSENTPPPGGVFADTSGPFNPNEQSV